MDPMTDRFERLERQFRRFIRAFHQGLAESRDSANPIDCGNIADCGKLSKKWKNF
ncbi:MAG: hypothetical protein ACYC61_13140 [Isosphaeraceae bacterium]